MGQKIKVIYILGHSRSGSTILGFHLGAFKHVFYAGEIKRFGNKRVYERMCTCGETALGCSFWGHFIASNKDYFSKTSRNDGLFLMLLSSLKYILFRPSKSSISKEFKLLKNLFRSINEEIEACDYIVDTSKSLNRLLVLKSIPEIDVYTVYLSRDIRHNLASFVKRKQNMLLNYMRLRVNDKLINWYLRNRSDHHISLKYEEFINDQEGTAEKISSFAEMNELISKPTDKIKYHLITGSVNTRKAFTKNPKVEILNKNIDEPFSPRQARILKLLGL